MQAEQKRKLNSKFLIILIVLVLAGAGYGFYAYNHAQAHETTDDAQVEAKISPIIPRVSGYIKEIRVEDNQWVKKGDTLLVLDNEEFLLKLDQAEAALQIANSQLKAAGASAQTSGSSLPVTEASAQSAQANIATANANIEAAKVQLWRATNDFERYENLFKEKSVTKQQYEQALAAKQSAEKQLEVLTEQRNAIQKQAKVASTQIGSTKSQIEAAQSQVGVASANLNQGKVAIENAKLYLKYTIVTAPEDGQVSKVNLQVGQFVQAGQSLMMLVGVQSQWVVANFKETQLEKMRIGQQVKIKVDAYPNELFEGQIQSIAAATGSKFALLPPDNASGNFVKTIQRIPVKILFKDTKSEVFKLLRPGMNAEVDVYVAP